MRRVAMLISNGYGPDVRVQKEAHTLALAGYRVTVLAWDRAGRYPVHAMEQAPASLVAALADWPERRTDAPALVSIVRIQVPAGYRTGRALLHRMPLFWWRAFQELRRVRPDVVHAHDLDTLPVAWLYARWAGVPVIYDAREYYPGMVRGTVGQGMSRALDWLDHRLAPRADAVLTVGERLAARYRTMGARVWIVYNSQPLPDPDTISTAGRNLRRSLGVPDDALLVVYVGWLNPDRLLAPLLAAVPRVENAWLVIGGDGPQMAQVQAAAAACTRIRVLGWVPLNEVPDLVAAGNVVYYGLDATDPNSFYFMPNLAFFALATGRPLLTTPVGEIAEVVRGETCGMVVEAATAEAVEDALYRLADTEQYATLAARARYLGQTAYHWGSAAAQIIDAYGCIVDVKNCL